MKLHRCYFSEKTDLTVRIEVVKVKAFPIIVWVSISPDAIAAWDPRLPRLPAILDIGTTHNFAITKAHLARWAGIHVASLSELGKVRIEGRRAPRCGAGLWLHSDRDPFNLSIDDGIAVFDGAWPRLPILGLRALTNSKLQTLIYGDTKQVLIRTPPKWYWPF